MSVVYKIFNPVTGLYSSGGTSPKWTKDGKCWAKLAHLKNHLHLVEDGMRWLQLPNPYEGCLIHEFQLFAYKTIGSITEEKE